MRAQLSWQSPRLIIVLSQVQVLSFAPRRNISVELRARLDNEQANWVANPTKTMVVNTARDLIRSSGRSPSVVSENYQCSPGFAATAAIWEDSIKGECTGLKHRLERLDSSSSHHQTLTATYNIPAIFGRKESLVYIWVGSTGECGIKSTAGSQFDSNPIHQIWVSIQVVKGASLVRLVSRRYAG